MKKNHCHKGGVYVCLLFLLLGCATTKDVKILDEEIYKLQQQVNQLRKEKETLKEELSQQTVENQKLKADLLLRLETLQSDVRTLSTGVEEYKEFLKRPSKEIDRMRDDLEFRIKILDDKSKTNEERLRDLEVRLKEVESSQLKLSESISKPVETETPKEWKGISAGVGDLYKDAYETLQRGEIDGARRKFEAFLKQYPNTELSDNAQFWIGETYYLKKDFEKAILEYEKAIAKYPEGDKIPAALFKQALAFLELGDKTNARNLLRRVIEKYPNSDQAERAKKKLETIK